LPCGLKAKQGALNRAARKHMVVGGGDGVWWELAKEAFRGLAVSLAERLVSRPKELAVCPQCPDCRLESPSEVVSRPLLLLCISLALIAGLAIGCVAASCCRAFPRRAETAPRRVVDDRRILFNARVGAGY
jgi:hypothetical protein